MIGIGKIKVHFNDLDAFDQAMRFATWSPLTSLLLDPSLPKILQKSVASGMGRAGIEVGQQKSLVRLSLWWSIVNQIGRLSGPLQGPFVSKNSSHTSGLLNQQIDRSSKGCDAGRVKLLTDHLVS